MISESMPIDELIMILISISLAIYKILDKKALKYILMINYLLAVGKITNYIKYLPNYLKFLII